MSDTDDHIDWSRTTFEGSRREQLRRWQAMSLRERLEALDSLSAHADQGRDGIAYVRRSAAESAAVRERSPGFGSAVGQNEFPLRGCTPTPLAAYLKALAVLRLVAEQAGDPDAAGYWRDDVFVLRTRLAEEELLDFFLERYQPTPLVAPWNGGSGFYFQEGKQDQKDPATGKKLKTGIRDQETGATRVVDLLARSTAERLEDYRETIELARVSVASFGLEAAPAGKSADTKRQLITHVRNTTISRSLSWIDATVVLGQDELGWPPILGTGGNDGNLDFTTNFMQNLLDVIDPATGNARIGSSRLLRAALFGVATPSLSKRAVGQFAPGSAGGPNATTGFDGSSRVIAWDFILMLEGAVLLAASAARRLDATSAATTSAPFTVHSRAATAGAAAADDDGDARGEIWMPLWSGAATLVEIQTLLAEGRAALGARPVHNGLDFARAVARLGVDRGITAFQRYGFLMRSGKAFLATPLTRVPVRRNQQADVIDDLDRGGWLSRVQRFARDDHAPNAFRSIAAQLDGALFALTQRQERNAVESVLRLLGRLEAVVARSPKSREQVGPVPVLQQAWADRAADGSAEFRIAAALAALSMRGSMDGRPIELRLRPHLVPVSLGSNEWNAASHLVSWGPGALERNLAEVLRRRRLESLRIGGDGEELRSHVGATLDAVTQLLVNTTDDRRIAELAHGLACVRLRGLAQPPSAAPFSLPAAYAVLKPFFTPDSLLHELDWLPTEKTGRLPAEIPARLAADDVAAAVQSAWSRMRALGVMLPPQDPPRPPRRGDGPRLLAALTIPLTYGETRRLLDWFGYTREPEGDADPYPATTA